MVIAGAVATTASATTSHGATKAPGIHLNVKVKVVHLPTQWFMNVYQQKLHTLNRDAVRLPIAMDLARGVHGRSILNAPRQDTRHAGRNCSEPNCPMPWNGGPVQHTPVVNILYWGPVWGTTTDTTNAFNYLNAYFDGVGNDTVDTWSPIMQQYYDSVSNISFDSSTPVEVGLYTLGSTPPFGAQGTDIEAASEALDAYITTNGGHQGINVNNIIATQPGTCPYQFAGPGCPGGAVYCAWHSYDSSQSQPFTNLPYQPDAGGSCGENSVSGEFDGFSIVGGHEFAETVTDPQINAWVDTGDPFGGEIGDKCAWTNLQDTQFSTGFFPTQPLWSNAEFSLSGNGCPQSEFDNVGLSGSATSLQVGQSVTLTGTINTDVLPTPWWIVIYNLTTASAVRFCGSGTSCGYTVQGNAPGTDQYVSLIATSTLGSIIRESAAWSVTWSKANTATHVSVSGTPPAAGGSATVNVSVAGAFPGAGVPAPSGSVTVSNGSHTCNATLSGSNGTSTGSCALVFPHAGSITITGGFAADANFLASSGNTTLTVSKAKSVTTLTETKSSIAFGSENKEVFKVHVTGGGGPTGSVKIMKGTTVVCTATLSLGVGHCSPTAKKLAKGSYTIVAKYAGDANDLASTSTGVKLKVT